MRSEIEQAVRGILCEQDTPDHPRNAPETDERWLTKDNMNEWLHWAKWVIDDDGYNFICCDNALNQIAGVMGIDRPQAEYEDQAAYIAGRAVKEFGVDPEVFLDWNDGRFC